MALDVFDLTEHTQISIKKDTNLHDGLSLHVFISKDQCLSDAVEWSRAVEMAHWIINADERYNTERRRPSWWVVGECDQCQLAYCCDHLDECRTKDADGNWIHPCVSFMKEE